MADYNQDGLKAAAQSFARTMKRVAAVRTRTGADAVNTAWEDNDVVLIRAGRPGGNYGWEPIVPMMFDNNLRHPFFGNMKRWYNQGYYGITEETINQGFDQAADAYMERAIDPLLEEHGFDQ